MLPSGSDREDLLAEVAEWLHAQPDLSTTGEQVLAFAQQTLEVEHAGVTAIAGDAEQRTWSLTTLVASDPVVQTVDRLQVELEEGACWDTAWEQQYLVAEDLEREGRWPRWSPRACGLGLRSMLAVELGTGARRIGALNLYSTRPRRFEADEIGFAQLFGRHAALALAASWQETTLLEAVDARTLIGQAQGILMERFQLDANQAFEVLRRYSQASNTKLRQIAEELVATRALPARPHGTGSLSQERRRNPDLRGRGDTDARD